MIAKKRVLFVDDEVPILEGLERRLRKESRRWDMVFANSGAAALAELARAPVDVVVTDMRMPGMDGAALLSLVKAEYPAAARLVLSGHADQEAILRALPVTQQFLSKPCDGEALRVAVERTCDLHRILVDPKLRQIVGRMTRLPTLSTTYSEISRLATDPSSSAADIARVMERDPAMSAKVLQLVNSAYFGTPQRIIAVPQAVVYLGVGLLKGLVLSSQIFGALEATSPAPSLLQQFQNHALLVAQVARSLVRDPKKADEAFTAGLLHDVGSIVLAHEMPEQADAVSRYVSQGRSACEAECEILGVSHAEVGAYLLGVWGLPFALTEVAAFHHHPSAITEGPGDLIAAVHAADNLIDQGPEASLDLAFLERVGLLDELPRWREVAGEARKRAATRAS